MVEETKKDEYRDIPITRDQILKYFRSGSFKTKMVAIIDKHKKIKEI